MNSVFQDAYTKLNSRQKEAVDAIEGPVMVIAGPGTGKTQILSLRITNILKKTDTKADGVLCLTFTNSGVSAMRKRLHSYIGGEASKIAINTFHSFGTKLIEEFYEVLELERVPETLDEGGTIALIDHILNAHQWEYIRPRGNSAFYYRDIKSLISLLKRERITPEQFLIQVEGDIETLKNDPASISSRGESKGNLKKEVESKIESLKKTREVVRFYELYEEAKKEGGLMDYDDILSYMVRIADMSEDACATIRERYLYVLVDEHQDSSGSQNEFLKLVWGPVEQPNIFVVGDDRQLIYGFGGASLSHFEEFKHTFSGVKVITLVENYRSTQTILDAADTLLQSTLTNEKLKSQTSETHPICLVECEYPRDEILRAGLFFKERIEAGTPASECALLVPKNAHVRSAVAILRDMGLPATSTQSLRLFDTTEVHSFIHILKVIAEPSSRISLAELILDPISRIPPYEAHQFLHLTHNRDLSIKTLQEQGEKGSLFGDTNPVSVFGKKLEDVVNASAGMSVYQLIQHVGQEFFLQETEDHDTYVKRIEIVRSLLHLVLSLEEKNPRVSLADFIEFINRLEEYGEDIPLAVFGAREGIQVMTLHGSKGLEYDAVWIAHMNERTLMSSKKMGFALPEILKEKIEQKDEAIARRELYVAITRARKYCTLSYARLSHKGSEERVAAIVESLPQEMFSFEECSDSQKGIMDNDPLHFVASRPSIENPMTKEMLRELVKEHYHGVKVSVTLLNAFYECPWKWYFRSFLQVPEPLSESLQFGSIVHGAIERIIKDERNIGEKDIKQAISEEIANCHLVDPKVITRLEREAFAVVSRFVTNALPDISKKRESEKALSYRDPDISDVLITGKIDLFEQDGGRMRVTDFKTGKTRTAREIEKEDEEGRLSSYLRQLAMYSYLLNRAFKKEDVDISRLYFIEESDAKKAIYSTRIVDEHIGLLIRDIKDYDAMMRSGVWTERECNAKTWGSGDTECEYCKRAKMYQG